MNPRATKRPDDGPLLARVKRVRKGEYIVNVVLPYTRRIYHTETMLAPTVEQVRERMQRHWPTLVWKQKAKRVAPCKRPKRATSKRITKRKRSSRNARKRKSSPAL